MVLKLLIKELILKAILVEEQHQLLVHQAVMQTLVNFLVALKLVVTKETLVEQVLVVVLLDQLVQQVDTELVKLGELWVVTILATQVEHQDSNG